MRDQQTSNRYLILADSDSEDEHDDEQGAEDEDLDSSSYCNSEELMEQFAVSAREAYRGSQDGLYPPEEDYLAYESEQDDHSVERVSGDAALLPETTTTHRREVVGPRGAPPPSHSVSGYNPETGEFRRTEAVDGTPQPQTSGLGAFALLADSDESDSEDESEDDEQAADELQVPRVTAPIESSTTSTESPTTSHDRVHRVLTADGIVMTADGIVTREPVAFSEQLAISSHIVSPTPSRVSHNHTNLEDDTSVEDQADSSSGEVMLREAIRTPLPIAYRELSEGTVVNTTGQANILDHVIIPQDETSCYPELAALIVLLLQESQLEISLAFAQIGLLLNTLNSTTEIQRPTPTRALTEAYGRDEIPQTEFVWTTDGEPLILSNPIPTRPLGSVALMYAAQWLMTIVSGGEFHAIANEGDYSSHAVGRRFAEEVEDASGGAAATIQEQHPSLASSATGEEPAAEDAEQDAEPESPDPQPSPAPGSQEFPAPRERSRAMHHVSELPTVVEEEDDESDQGWEELQTEDASVDQQDAESESPDPQPSPAHGMGEEHAADGFVVVVPAAGEEPAAEDAVSAQRDVADAAEVAATRSSSGFFGALTSWFTGAASGGAAASPAPTTEDAVVVPTAEEEVEISLEVSGAIMAASTWIQNFGC